MIVNLSWYPVTVVELVNKVVWSVARLVQQALPGGGSLLPSTCLTIRLNILLMSNDFIQIIR